MLILSDSFGVQRTSEELLEFLEVSASLTISLVQTRGHDSQRGQSNKRKIATSFMEETWGSPLSLVLRIDTTLIVLM